MLLSTPLTVPEILHGQILALKRSFLLPVVITLTVEIVGCFGGLLVFGGASRGQTVLAVGLSFFGISVYLGTFVLDLLAVTWAGMWFGLSSRNETQATFKTILYVLVLPCFTAVFSCFGVPLFVASSVIWLLWARQKVRLEFRTLAGQRFDSSTAASGWWPFQKSTYTRLPPQIPAAIPALSADFSGPAAGEKK